MCQSRLYWISTHSNTKLPFVLAFKAKIDGGTPLLAGAQAPLRASVMVSDEILGHPSGPRLQGQTEVDAAVHSTNITNADLMFVAIPSIYTLHVALPDHSEVSVW